jgi:hypothetical protein
MVLALMLAAREVNVLAVAAYLLILSSRLSLPAGKIPTSYL